MSEQLRKDIYELFSPDYCKVLETSARDIFLIKETSRRICFPQLSIPKEALEIARSGLKSFYGHLELERVQKERSWATGDPVITSDVVRSYAVDVSGRHHKTVFVARADLLQPGLVVTDGLLERKDDLFPRIIQACLENVRSQAS